MNKPALEMAGVRTFFSASEERVERWRELHHIAKALASGASQTEKLRSEATAQLARLAPLEELCGYPGPRLPPELSPGGCPLGAPAEGSSSSITRPWTWPTSA